MGPLLKWAGGKARLVDRISAAFGDRPGTRWVEPFLGSASVYLGISPELRGTRSPILSDANGRLVGFHRAVRDLPLHLLQHLSSLPAKRPEWEEAYLRVRASFNGHLAHESPEQAARFLWLNRACFNGLYRENRRGLFNVPKGRYQRLSLPTESQVLEVSDALSGTYLRQGDFRSVLEEVGPGDRVYCDPPYVPMSATSSFASYSAGGFSAGDQQDLARLARSAAARGAAVVISNHDVPAALALYPEEFFRIERFSVRRSISRGRRGEVGEILAISR